MLARTPVVASDIRSVSDAITDGATELLRAPGDVAAVHGAVNRILETRSCAEPSRRQRSIARQQRFTAATMASLYDSLWTAGADLISGRPAPVIVIDFSGLTTA